MTPTEQYLTRCAELIESVRLQQAVIHKAADWFAKSILAGRMVRVFASGHSRIMVEEMWPRYGSFPGFNPIVELSLTFHNLVVGSNGQRQAIFIENVPGLAERVLPNFALSSDDSALVISSSGCSVVPIEIAQEFKRHQIRVASIVSVRHSEKSHIRHPEGEKASGFLRFGSGHRSSSGRCHGEHSWIGHSSIAEFHDRWMPSRQLYQGPTRPSAHEGLERHRQFSAAPQLSVKNELPRCLRQPTMSMLIGWQSCTPPWGLTDTKRHEG